LYHSDFNFVRQEGDIIISDEADYLMFKDPRAFHAVATKYPMISMTASRPITTSESIEETVFKDMGMKTFVYNQGHVVKYDFDRVLSPMKNDEFTKFLELESTHHTLLVFCEKELASKIGDQVANSIEITINTSQEFIRNLDKRHGSGKFNLCYTSDPATMRGFDYRSRDHGICLVIAKSFESHRDFD
jgi:hypothetical protein